MSGPGRTTRKERSSTGIRTCRASRSRAKTADPAVSNDQPAETTSHGARRRRALRLEAARSKRRKETTMIKRLLFFAYGLTAYVMFLGTFLYAIAFVGGFSVPARLDGPLEGSISAALVM